MWSFALQIAFLAIISLQSTLALRPILRLRGASLRMMNSPSVQVIQMGVDAFHNILKDNSVKKVHHIAVLIYIQAFCPVYFIIELPNHRCPRVR